MTVLSSQVAVTSTPVKVNTFETDPSVGQSIAVKNTGSAVVYVGGSNAVSPSTGWPLAAGEAVSVDIYGAEAVWVVCATNSTVATLASGA